MSATCVLSVLLASCPAFAAMPRTETLHLRGLDPEATYSIKEINCGERLHLARRVEDAAPQSATGRDLMERGLAVTFSGDYDSAVFEVRRVCGGGCGASEAER